MDSSPRSIYGRGTIEIRGEKRDYTVNGVGLLSYLWGRGGSKMRSYADKKQKTWRTMLKLNIFVQDAMNRVKDKLH